MYFVLWFKLCSADKISSRSVLWEFFILNQKSSWSIYFLILRLIRSHSGISDFLFYCLISSHLKCRENFGKNIKTFYRIGYIGFWVWDISSWNIRNFRFWKNIKLFVILISFYFLDLKQESTPSSPDIFFCMENCKRYLTAYEKIVKHILLPSITVHDKIILFA